MTSEPRRSRRVPHLGTDAVAHDAEYLAIANRAEAISLCLAGFLAVSKAGAFLLTGSVAILASAADSLLDVAASGVNWLAVRAASEPPDEAHSYGHGKFEAVAGVFQAGVVTTAAGYLLYESVRRFVSHQTVDHVALGIAVMCVSIAVSLIIVGVLRHAARRTGSLAVSGDALHYTSDVLANLATIVALVLVELTGQHLWDPLIALALTAYLLRAAWNVFVPSWNVLVDHQLSDSERQLVELSLQVAAPPEVVGYYNLRTRTSGRKHFADVCVVFHPGTPFPRVHDITESLEAAVVSRFERADVVIHPEPLGAHGKSTVTLAWQRPVAPGPAAVTGGDA